MQKKKKSKKVTDETSSLVGEMKEKRTRERKALRTMAPLLQAQVATVWRWEHGISVPNQFHVYQIRKWLGYL